MPPELYDIESKEDLPPIEGPKLKWFKHTPSSIVLHELLSSLPSPHDKGESSSGGHGHVFRVEIDKQTYALKVFDFFNIDEARENELPHNRRVDKDTFLYQSDPFFAECRAYGRIEELQRTHQKRPRRTSRDLAVPCYGFIGLDTKHFEELFATKFHILDWNRDPDELDLPISKRSPFRAIVKKLMDGQKPIQNPTRMARDLRFLQNHGVVQHDVFERNYLEGLLVDFSCAWTTPHWVFEQLSPAALEVRKQRDFRDFDSMLKEAGVKIRFRMAKSIDTYAKLRSLPYDGPRRHVQTMTRKTLVPIGDKKRSA